MTQPLSDLVQLFWRRLPDPGAFAAPDTATRFLLENNGLEPHSTGNVPARPEDAGAHAEIALGALHRELPACRIWLLYVGGAEQAATIGGYVQQGAPGLGVLAVTTQKSAQRVLRVVLPDCILLETTAAANSRARFAQLLRRRLPDARLVAVGPRPAEGFAFDVYWEPPLRQAYLTELLPGLDAASESHIVQRGSIRLDLLTRTVVTPRGVHRLTPKQCALLQLLLERHNQIVSRRDIMQAIWDTTFMEDTRTLDVHIRWLRQCIEPDPSEPIYLHTVRGKGYHLRVDGA